MSSVLNHHEQPPPSTKWLEGAEIAWSDVQELAASILPQSPLYKCEKLINMELGCNSSISVQHVTKLSLQFGCSMVAPRTGGAAEHAQPT